jgi:hypothetical protein
MAVAKIGAIEQLFSNAGAVGNGFKLYTYEAGTTTPLATYFDFAQTAPGNTNPVVADSAGRMEVWVTKGVAYKLVLKTSADVTLETVDYYSIADETASSATTAHDVWAFFAVGTPPLTEELLYQGTFARAVTFPANWAGSYGDVNTNATGTFLLTVKKNGSTVGTVSIATNGTFTFATSAGAAVSYAVGDKITIHAPVATDATVEGISVTLAGSLT